MDKYIAFRKLMDFVADDAEIIDADLNYYKDTMLIVGENDQETITIEVTIKKKGENEDA